MKKFSKEELQPQADKFMKAHNVDSFLATEDGNFFHPRDKGLAHDHNNKNVKGEVYEFGKMIQAEKPAPKKAVKEHDVDTHGDADEAAKAAAAAKAVADKEAADKAAAKKQ